MASSSTNQRNNAIEVLAETASHDELLNRSDDVKHGSRSSSGNELNAEDPFSGDSTSSGAKGTYGNSNSGRPQKQKIRRARTMMVMDCACARASGL